MKRIAELTDQSLLGRDGWATAEPRRTARGILRNEAGLYAVIYAESWGLHNLPGGGVEPGESPVEALRRELLEETGCVCRQIEELGYVYENRAYCNFTQNAYYFVAQCSGTPASLHLTDEERAQGITCLWLPLEEVAERIRAFRPQTDQQRYLRARDLAALEAYMAQNSK